MILFSYCVPIRNRASDFKEALPTILSAARKSPPVEIAVLDYGSTDSLVSYLGPYFTEISYRFHRAPYFHMAHARNLSMNAGRGDYLISTNADTLLDESYFEVVRELVERTRCDVALAGKKKNGVVVVKREEFIKAGGFDERFEFYGPEDKDLVNRLKRRKLHIEHYNPKLLSNIPTSDKKKAQGYRLNISKWDMKDLMYPIFRENEAAGKLTVNDDI
jgi:hypothetical protein